MVVWDSCADGGPVPEDDYDHPSQENYREKLYLLSTIAAVKAELPGKIYTLMKNLWRDGWVPQHLLKLSLGKSPYAVPLFCEILL